MVSKKKKEPNICVRVGYKNSSLEITICHHSASLVMPIGDLREGFVYPTLTLMMNSYYLLYVHVQLYIFIIVAMLHIGHLSTIG